MFHGGLNSTVIDVNIPSNRQGLIGPFLGSVLRPLRDVGRGLKSLQRSLTLLGICEHTRTRRGQGAGGICPSNSAKKVDPFGQIRQQSQ